MTQAKPARLEDELIPDIKRMVLEYLSKHEVPASAWEAVQHYRIQFARDVLTHLPTIAGERKHAQVSVPQKPSIDMLIYELANAGNKPIVELEGAPRHTTETVPEYDDSYGRRVYEHYRVAWE